MPETQCSVAECTNNRHGRHRLCSMHRARLWRHGDTSTVLKPGTKPAEPAYRTLHWQISKARGKAATHQCAHCGVNAQQWAYDHTDPHPITGLTGGYALKYSTDINRYIPLCRICHKAFDGA